MNKLICLDEMMGVFILMNSKEGRDGESEKKKWCQIAILILSMGSLSLSLTHTHAHTFENALFVPSHK